MFFFFVFPSFYFYLSFLIRPTFSLKSLPSSTCRPFNSFRYLHLQELRRRLGVLEKALKQQVQAEVGRHRATAKKLYSLQLEHHKLEEQLKVGNLSPSPFTAKWSLAFPDPSVSRLQYLLVQSRPKALSHFLRQFLPFRVNEGLQVCMQTGHLPEDVATVSV